MRQLSSTGAPVPTTPPVPHGPKAVDNAEANTQDMREPDPPFSLPKIRLEARDLCHAGSKAFLSSVAPSIAMEFAVKGVLGILYLNPKCPMTTIPGTRSVTLILRSMEGVAYTTGMELDDDHKEIHFSIEYINGIDDSRRSDEILGVLVHEAVHCYQYNGSGTCPGGLVEGIADWVRLKCNLSPPHWKKEPSEKWDAGYQHTGYFLDYLEQRYGNGTISRMNEKLRTDKYEEKAFWTELLGRPVEQLWGDYQTSIKTERQHLDKVMEEDEIKEEETRTAS
jgi:Peptidase of plants and bacteria